MSEVLQIVEKASTLGISGLTVVLAFWFVLRPITAKIIEVINGAYDDHKAFIKSTTEVNQQNADSKARIVTIMESSMKGQDSIKKTLNGYADVAELATDLIPEHHKETAEEIRTRIRRLRNQE